MRKMNAFVAFMLAAIGLDQADSRFLFNTMITSRSMYTADWIFKTSPISWASKFMMEFATLHGITENAPYWESEVTLTNHHGGSMAGFVAFQSMMFDPKKPIATLRRSAFGNLNSLCQHRDYLEHGSKVEHNVHFEDWRFDPMSERSSELRLNVTQPVHKTGLWINIAHLCVTEGHFFGYRAVTMHGHQTAVNPLGFLDGHSLMALPILMSLLVLYAVIGFLWAVRMVVHRQNIIRWIHWPLAVGIALGFFETMLRFTRFFSANAYGFHHVTRTRVIAHATATIVTMMYRSVMMTIFCGGVGIARTGLGQKTKIFLAFYIVTHCAAFARVEYLEFFVFMHGYFGASNFEEMQSLCRFLVLSQVVLFVVSFFNLHGVLDRLERNGQEFKIGMYNCLAAIVIFSVIAHIQLVSTGHHVHDYGHEASNWILYYLMKEGFQRILSVVTMSAVLWVFSPHAHSLRLILSEQVDPSATDVDLDDSHHGTKPEDEQTPHHSVTDHDTAHEESDTITTPTPTPLPLPSWINETTDSQ